MSQNIFSVSDGVECMVGFDVPMQTFFGQVYRVDRSGERVDDGMLHWVGVKMDEIRTVDHLQRLLRPHAKIPLDIFEILFEIEID